MLNVIIREPRLSTNHPPRCAVSSTFGVDAISAWTSSHVQPVSGSLLDKHFQTVHVCTSNDLQRSRGIPTGLLQGEKCLMAASPSWSKKKQLSRTLRKRERFKHQQGSSPALGSLTAILEIKYRFMASPRKHIRLVWRESGGGIQCARPRCLSRHITEPEPLQASMAINSDGGVGRGMKR